MCTRAGQMIRLKDGSGSVPQHRSEGGYLYIIRKGRGSDRGGGSDHRPRHWRHLVSLPFSVRNGTGRQSRPPQRALDHHQELLQRGAAGSGSAAELCEPGPGAGKKPALLILHDGGARRDLQGHLGIRLAVRIAWQGVRPGRVGSG